MSIERTDDLISAVAEPRESEESLHGFSRLENVQRAISSSLEKTVMNADSRDELLIALSNRLDKFFSIHKSSYSVYVPNRAMMQVPVISIRDEVKSGVIIGVDADKSLMHNVLRSRQVLVSEFPDQAVSNPIERRLLLHDDTRSLAIIPMIADEELLGTLNYASGARSAFSLFDLRIFDDLFRIAAERFGRLD